MKEKTVKPTLVKCGEHYVNIEEVRSIQAVREGSLYIIKFKDDPNPEWPMWAEPEEIESLLQHFRVEE